ncbi:hypothetical protein MHTCC0001_06380 [Flavobacteriaceae bacterium MHTCC 0001]
MHVGDTYFLLGHTTLKNGEEIEFQYGMIDYLNHPWETLEEYLERKKTE